MKSSTGFKTGLVVCALLGLLDVAALAGMGMDGAPPVGVAIGGGVLGIVTLAATIPAWRGGRGAVLTVIASRLISILLGVPVFFTDEAPGWARIVVSIVIVATVAGVALLAAAFRRPTTELSHSS
ncbi:MAG TPA: hypothetical protein DGG94_16490 [Micromonosporaceae bacterium]|nr:hypothetical protein [Micromonosporaceae bacterium]HCU51369.1 hypothetical protein [Micromonosporaceae bacterium]